MDGTLIPVRDRGVAASFRNYRFSANLQVIADADTRLVIAVARPVPGTTADAHASRASGLSELCQGATALGDSAMDPVAALVERSASVTPRSAADGD